MPDLLYIYGRVIRTEVNFEGFPAALIYVFKGTSNAKALPDRTVLRTSNILARPFLINRLGWSRGYFETIGNLPFEDGEIISPTPFRDLIKQDLVRDEYGNLLEKLPPGPCGFYGLSSYRVVDDEVSDALGIPQAPD